MKEEKSKPTLGTTWGSFRATVFDSSPEAIKDRNRVLKIYGRVFAPYAIFMVACFLGAQVTLGGTQEGKFLVGLCLFWLGVTLLESASKICSLERRLEMTERRLLDLLSKRDSSA